MIRLRELQEKDAPFMLEWMHDKEIQKAFKKDMSKMCLEDTQKFCRESGIPKEIKDGTCIHFAIVDEQDEYLGTISLKNFDLSSGNAEYAISVRKKVQGKGVAVKATELLLEKAFKEYGLHKVYLNVLADNKRAIRMYEKCGFVYEGVFKEHVRTIEGKYVDLLWYGMLEKKLG